MPHMLTNARRYFWKMVGIAVSALALLAPLSALAHEVYVLTPGDVSNILENEHINPITALLAQPYEFFLWGFIATVIILLVFFISISRRVEKRFDPMLFAIKKKYGLLIGRITLGLALIASGYYGAFFGPELAFHTVASEGIVVYLKVLFITLGIAILFGFGTRIAASIALVIYALVGYTVGFYTITYTNYLGEIIVMAVLGSHVISFDKTYFKWQGVLRDWARAFEPYAFLVLRVTFGISLIYASIYGKFLHAGLALHTVTEYHLTDYFHFDPLFIVLGAFIIEVLLGLFFIIGFEVRFSAIFISIFLTLSLLYFKELVWPHIILFGVAFALFVHGYDRYTLEGRFFKDAQHEPVL